MGRASAARGSRGFTLIELMIVVAVLAIIMAIAIPSMLRARMSANEASAIASMRTLYTSEMHFRVRYGMYGTIDDLFDVGTLDDTWVDGERSGYAFNIAVDIANDDWTGSAQPLTLGSTGNRFFFIDSTGVIRVREGAPAAVTDPPIDD